MALADWLLPPPYQPGGPVLVPFKPPSAGNIPGPKAVTPPLAGPFDFANAAANLANVSGENKLREAQANLYGLQGQQLTATLDLLKNYPSLMQSMFSGGTQDAGGKPTFGSLAPSSSSDSPGIAPSPAIDQITAGDDPEWRAFAQAVAGPESRGQFNVRYTPSGGTTFSGYEKHPNIPEPGPQGPSTAAGAWQILNSTWNGLPEGMRQDFKPETQYGGFKYIAERDYAQRTGRDLLADLRAGNLDQVEQGLRGTWPTIGKALRAYPNLLGNYTQAGTQVAQNAAPASGAADLPDTSLVGAGSTFRPKFGGAPMSLGGGMAGMMQPSAMPSTPSPGLAAMPSNSGPADTVVGSPTPTGADINAWASYNRAHPSTTWDQWVAAGAPGGSAGAATRGMPTTALPVAMPTQASGPLPQAPGALAPPQPSGQINPGFPGLERFDPVKAAIAGSMLEAFKLPNAAAPLLQLYQNSPGFKAAVANATKWAEAQPEIYTKWRVPMMVRPGSGITDPLTGAMTGYMPKLPEGFTLTPGPNGQNVAVPVPGALSGIQQASTAQAAGPAAFRPEAVPGPFGRQYTTTALNLPNLLGGGGATTSPTPVGGGFATGLPGAASQGARPESAAPAFPVQTIAGPKDVSQLSVDDLFPGGRGVPTPPAPPPGMTYGKPSETETQMQKDDASQIEEFNKQASGNQKIYQDVSHLRDVLQRGLQTSKLEPLWADIGNIAQGLGASEMLPKKFDPNDPAVFQKAATDLVFAAVKKLAGQVRVAEITGYQQANPSLTIPIPANLNIINDVLSNGKWEDARARLASDYATKTGGAPLGAFISRFNDMVPLVDMTDAYKNAVRNTPEYKQGLSRGVGYPEDVGANATRPQTPTTPTGATDTRTIGGITYHKIGGQWYH